MKKSILTVVVVIVACFYYHYTTRTKDKSPVIELATGCKIQGTVEKSRDGRDFYSYKGIPYAKAERFQLPQEPDKWNGVKSTTEFGPMCMQVDNLSWKVQGSETDCLTVNVFKPKHAPVGSPVLVYIHGGYFMTGNSHLNHPHYFMDENVILVTFHYRVGALGFLSTADGVIGGNFGLKDQTFLLKWVQSNKEKFGGGEVTIFGESAGASCVHFHLLSPMSKGLFNKAGSSSGTAIKPWSLSVKPKEQAIRLGTRLNCSVESSESLKSCLLKLKAEDIIETQIETITPLINPLIMYGPTVEKRKNPNDELFLPAHPYTLMKQGKFQKVPYLLGVNSHEGLLITGRIDRDAELLADLQDNFYSVLPQYLLYPPENKKLTRNILNFYLESPPKDGEKLDFRTNFNSLTNLMTDRLYLVATRETALHHAQHSPTFLYYNKYQGEFSFTTFFGFTPNIHWTLQLAWRLIYNDILKKLGFYKYDTGVSHGDDLLLIFMVPYMESLPGMRDYAFSKNLVRLWAQFAHDENKMSCNGALWTALPSDILNSTEKVSKLQYLTFETSGKHGMKDEEFTQRVQFYKSLKLPWID